MLDSYITAVQNSKKDFIKLTVWDSKLADICNQFVDAQTAYTQSAVKTATSTAWQLGVWANQACADRFTPKNP